MKMERNELYEVVDPILQATFPLGPKEDVSCILQECLKLVPDQMKVQQKVVVKTMAVHVLAMAKSHYPRVDLQ